MTIEIYQGQPNIRLRIRIYGLYEHTFSKRVALIGGHRPAYNERWQPQELSYPEQLGKRAYPRMVDGEGYSHQFLCILPVGLPLREVKLAIERQFSKLYPDEGKVRVLRLRDEFDCDLDDDFLVGQLFSNDGIMLTICQSVSGALGQDSARTFFTPVSHTEDSGSLKFIPSTAVVEQKEPVVSLPKPPRKRPAKKAPVTSDSDAPVLEPKSRKKAMKMETEKVKVTNTDKNTATDTDTRVNANTSSSTNTKASAVTKAPVLPNEPAVSKAIPTPQAIANLPVFEPTTVISDDTHLPRTVAAEDVHSPRPIHISTVLSLPKDAAELAAIIQAESDSDESSEDEAPLIPVVRSDSVTLLKGNPAEAAKAASSSEESDDEQEQSAFAQPRTSLTELTQELKRNSVDPVAPQSIRTKALLATQGGGDTNKGRRRRNYKKTAATPNK